MRKLSFIKILPALIFLFSLAYAETITIEYQNDTHKFLPDYVLECKKAAVQKLQFQADSYGVTVDMKTLRLSAVGDRWYNPFRYLWWSVDVIDVNGRTDVFPDDKNQILTMLTQKPGRGDCF